MGKVDENKKNEKRSPLQQPHTNFLPQMVSNATAISDIVEKAGVAKRDFLICILKTN